MVRDIPPTGSASAALILALATACAGIPPPVTQTSQDIEQTVEVLLTADSKQRQSPPVSAVETAVFVAVLQTLQAPSPGPISVTTPTPFLCPVTKPNGMLPPGELPSTDYHGNGTLWTVVWPEGILVFTPEGPGVINDDGSLGMKWPWWRSLPGVVTVHASRLDGLSPSMETVLLRGPDDGYGETGFHASSLVFPSAGCWEVSAQVQESTLTFVVLVVRVGAAE